MNKWYFLSSLLILSGLLTGSCNDPTPTSTNHSPVHTPVPSPSPHELRTPDKFKYNAKSRDYFGLYYLESKEMSDERKLIISEDDRPIPPKSNDPGEATIPGFYLSHENRLDFEEVDVNGKQISFKTRAVDGTNYEFRGTVGEEIVPDFSDDIPVPFIKGTLKETKNGTVVKTENVRFGHAVIL